MNKPANFSDEAFSAYDELERGVYHALETYANVHRGNGHHAMVTTRLFEQAREIVLEHLGLSKTKYEVIFCSPRFATKLMSQLKPGAYECLSGNDLGLSVGIRALAVQRNAFPAGPPINSGGGTTRLISRNWVIWDRAPGKFEAGTPAIINIIAFARAIRMIRKYGKDIFLEKKSQPLTSGEILFHDNLSDASGHSLLTTLRQTLIGRDVLVPTVDGPRPFINLDNAASTPTFLPVWDAFRLAWRQDPQIQKEIAGATKSVCAQFLDAPPEKFDVLFTLNTTEAINLVAESLGRENEKDTEPVILNTLLEHNSNELPWRLLQGHSLLRMPVNDEGFVDHDELEKTLSDYNEKALFGKKRIRLMALCGASNVIGVFNDIAAISSIVHRYGARLLVDAAQLAAHRGISMEKCGIDYLAFSAHKIYAPFGTGVLIARKGMLHFSPAELAEIRSSGEENAGGIAALGKALILLQRIGLDVIQAEEQTLASRLLQGLTKIPGLEVYGIRDHESPAFARRGGVFVFGLKGFLPAKLAGELTARGGIGLRYGCHCSHLLIKHLLHIPPSLEWVQGTLLHLFPKLSLPGLARISLGIQNTEKEVDTLLRLLNQLANEPKTKSSRAAREEINRQLEECAVEATRE
jgi:selenocysteine lyase/cysteine desulfurase